MMTRQPDRSVSRRAALTGLGVSGAALALAAARPAAAQDTASPAADTVRHPLAGTWIVTFQNPADMPTIAVWGADGSFVAPGNLFGVWEASGPRTALFTWVTFFEDTSGYLVVTGTITVEESGDEWTHPYSSMTVGPDGTVQIGDSGVVYARRLRPLSEDQIGTPIAVIPNWTPTPESATPAP